MQPKDQTSSTDQANDAATQNNKPKNKKKKGKAADAKVTATTPVSLEDAFENKRAKLIAAVSDDGADREEQEKPTSAKQPQSDADTPQDAAADTVESAEGDGDDSNETAEHDAAAAKAEDEEASKRAADPTRVKRTVFVGNLPADVSEKVRCGSVLV